MKKLKAITKWAAIIIGALILLYFVFSLIVRPSTDRNWTLDQKVLPHITLSTSTISIKNIRNFKYKSVSDYEANYYDEVFERGKVKDIWFVVEPFEGPQAAHTFLSFEFEDGKFLAISVEIRKEIGESYHPISGLFRKYELNYVIGSEQDLIGLRANHRKDQVFLYKVNTTKERANILFESMLVRAIKLQSEPEFYNTITNTCTTNIVSHVNDLVDDRVPFDYRILLPEYSDYFAYELGLIGEGEKLDNLKSKNKINDLAAKYDGQTNFSLGIRGRLE